MSCSTCFRAFSSSRRAICPPCAQIALHDPRIDQAVSLLDREKAHAHVEAIFRPGNDGVLASLPEDADWDAITEGMKKNWTDKSTAEQQATETRMDLITQRALELKAEIESYKHYIERERESHKQRRQELEDRRKQLKRHAAREPVQQAVRKTAFRQSKIQGRIIDARVYLCYQAASLVGLQRRRGADGKSEYWLANTLLVDLRNLSKMGIGHDTKDKSRSKSSAPEPHELYSASLEHICRLLTICCHYLSVRLPAEIVLPHHGSTRPMIYPERSSYKPRDGRQSTSTSSSPSASRIVDRNGTMPRPRVLYLDRPIQQLSKEDPKAFLFFLEGVMLLAWDIAWLCKTQGMDNTNSFEDVCALGRNLYRLLVSTSKRPTLDRKATPTTAQDERTNADAAPMPTGFGTFSHSSAQHALHGAAGMDILRNWRLSSPTVLTRLVDELSKHITSDLADQEWGILDEDEWDDEREDEQAVLIGGTRKSWGPSTAASNAAVSVMTVAPNEDTATVGDAVRGRGTSGWTKVRGRGIE